MRNYFFPTPEAVVQSIVRAEVCGQYNNVLEPAVGDGALLGALSGNYDALTAFDVDQSNLDKVLSRVNQEKARLYCKDFLSHALDKEFDLVLSNPPFNNNLAYYVEYEGRKVPIEAAFVIKSLGCLSVGGKAVFVLPSSIMVGEKLKWLREYIFNLYKICSIYKLPKFSFGKIESGFYILCVENVVSDDYEVALSMADNLSYHISSSLLRFYDYCLDPEYLSQIIKYDKVLESLGGMNLSDVATVLRGNVGATGNKSKVYHSTDFKSHVASEKTFTHCIVSSALASKYDILLKRVCRSASASFSIYEGDEKAPCSDCVIVISPKKKSKLLAVRLLLILRVAMLMGGNCFFEVSGSGANYINLGRLKKLVLPGVKFFDDKKLVEKYSVCVFSDDPFSAIEFEKKVVSDIFDKLESQSVLYETKVYKRPAIYSENIHVTLGGSC